MEGNQRHHALHLVLDVLESLEAGERGISDVARELGVTKSNVHKILKNLEDRGYVRSRDSRYSLGLRLWQLGATSVAGLGLRQVALPKMEKLSELTGEGTLLSVYDRGDVTYLEKVTSPQPVVATTRIGGRSPAFCTATGKAILAWLPAELVDEALSGDLTRYNEATVTDVALIREDLADVRRHGFAVNRGAWRGEIHGVAAPVRDHSSRVVAALGVTGPAFRFGEGGIEAMAPAVVAAAEEISRELGWEGL